MNSSVTSNSNDSSPLNACISLHDIEILSAAVELWLALGKEIATLSTGSSRQDEDSTALLSSMETATIASRSIVENARKTYNKEQKRARRLLEAERSNQPLPENIQKYRVTEIAQILDIEPYVLLYWEDRFKIREMTIKIKGVKYYGEHLLEMFQKIKKLLYEDKFTIAGTDRLVQQMKREWGATGKIGEPKSESLIPDKQYFKIGEVSEIIDVEPYVMRYWQSEFRIFKPTRTRARQRLYHKKDVESFLTIKKLIYDEKFTIAGAKERFKEIRKWEIEERRSLRAIKAISDALQDFETQSGPQSPDLARERIGRVLKKSRTFLKELHAIRTEQKEMSNA